MSERESGRLRRSERPGWPASLSLTIILTITLSLKIPHVFALPHTLLATPVSFPESAFTGSGAKEKSQSNDFTHMIQSIRSNNFQSNTFPPVRGDPRKRKQGMDFRTLDLMLEKNPNGKKTLGPWVLCLNKTNHARAFEGVIGAVCVLKNTI